MGEIRFARLNTACLITLRNPASATKRLWHILLSASRRYMAALRSMRGESNPAAASLACHMCLRSHREENKAAVSSFLAIKKLQCASQRCTKRLSAKSIHMVAAKGHGCVCPALFILWWQVMIPMYLYCHYCHLQWNNNNIIPIILKCRL